MSDPQLSQIARQMRRGLLRELGQGVDVERLLADARYARDVLLACDGFDGSELPLLSAQFRRVAAEDAAQPDDGVGGSSPPRLPAARAAGAGGDKRSRRWNNPSSWFGA